MPPNLKFEADGCYLEYNYSKTYAGQTLEVPKGTVVDVHVRVHNQGDFGKIAIQAYDYKNDRELIWKETTMGRDEHLGFYIGKITVDTDMDITFVAWYWDESLGKWQWTDIIG